MAKNNWLTGFVFIPILVEFWDPTLKKKLVFAPMFCRVPKGGVFKGGGNWGTLRIPREDWGTLLGKIREPPPLGTPPLTTL